VRSRPPSRKQEQDPIFPYYSCIVITPAKRHPGRPLGSKNKKSSEATTNLADRLFSFFSFLGDQCREQQCLPLNFTEFMESRELWEAVLQETSSGGPPYELEVYYDGNSDVFFRGGWDHFAEDQDLQQ
jgi:hypothetical protein